MTTAECLRSLPVGTVFIFGVDHNMYVKVTPGLYQSIRGQQDDRYADALHTRDFDLGVDDPDFAYYAEDVSADILEQWSFEVDTQWEREWKWKW